MLPSAASATVYGHGPAGGHDCAGHQSAADAAQFFSSNKTPPPHDSGHDIDCCALGCAGAALAALDIAILKPLTIGTIFDRHHKSINAVALQVDSPPPKV